MLVCSQIKKNYPDLSKSQKKVADYVVDHLEQAAMYTTVKISMEADVSETTVIRFARALGYESFSAFQKQLRMDVLERSKDWDLAKSGEQNHFQRILSRQASLLLEMRDRQIDFEQLQRIAEHIATADHVMVFGYYGEHTVAYQLYFMLDSIRPNVHYYRENSIGFRQMTELNLRSAVISVTFAPYCPGTLELMQETRERKPYMITITDSHETPAAKLSDDVVVFPLERDPETGINCMVPATAYCFLLMHAVKDCNKEEVLYRIKNVPSQLVQPEMPLLRMDNRWLGQ